MTETDRRGTMEVMSDDWRPLYNTFAEKLQCGILLLKLSSKGAKEQKTVVYMTNEGNLEWRRPFPGEQGYSPTAHAKMELRGKKPGSSLAFADLDNVEFKQNPGFEEQWFLRLSFGGRWNRHLDFKFTNSQRGAGVYYGFRSVYQAAAAGHFGPATPSTQTLEIDTRAADPVPLGTATAQLAGDDDSQHTCCFGEFEFDDVGHLPCPHRVHHYVKSVKNQLSMKIPKPTTPVVAVERKPAVTEEQKHARAKHRWHMAIDDVEATLMFTGGDEKSHWYLIYHRPRYDDCYTKHKPWFMITISLVQILCFAIFASMSDEAVTASTPVGGDEVEFYRPVESDGNSWASGTESTWGMAGTSWTAASAEEPCADFRGQVWRLFTYQFVHAGYSHVAFNMIIQLLLGAPLEMVHGPWRMFLVYELGVFGGALTCSFADVFKSVVGASGGVYSLFGIHFANLFLNWDDMVTTFICMKTRMWTLFILAFFCTSDVYTYFTSHNDATSYTAHLGGVIMGFFAGCAVLQNLYHEKYEDILQGVFIFIGLGYLIFGISWYGTHDPPQTAPFLWYSEDPASMPCCYKYRHSGFPLDDTTFDDYRCVSNDLYYQGSDQYCWSSADGWSASCD